VTPASKHSVVLTVVHLLTNTLFKKKSGRDARGAAKSQRR